MTDPFDTVREALKDSVPPFGLLPKARKALASIEEKLTQTRIVLEAATQELELRDQESLEIEERLKKAERERR